MARTLPGSCIFSSTASQRPGQIPYLATRAETKVFWFFSSEKNALANF
jgi:hypothetical protein